MLHGLKSKEGIEDCELFSDLLFSLYENDILILNKHKDFLFHNEVLLTKKRSIETEFENYKQNLELIQIQNLLISHSAWLTKRRNETDIKEDIESIKRKIEEYKKEINPEFFQLLKVNLSTKFKIYIIKDY